MRTSDSPRQALVIERGIRIALVAAVVTGLVPVGTARGWVHVLLLVTGGIAVAFVALRAVARQRRPRLGANGNQRFFALRYRGIFRYTAGGSVLDGDGIDYRPTRRVGDEAMSMP